MGRLRSASQRGEPALNRFIATVRHISTASGVVAGCLVAAAIVVVCQMVFWRYALNASTVWQTEFVTFSLVAATFIGCPYVQLRRGHVHVDLLPLYLGHGGRVVLALLALTAAFAFCGLLAWTGFVLWEEAWAGGWVTDTVWELPLWIPYLPMPVGLGLLCLQLTADFLSVLRGDEAPFGIDPQHGAGERV